MEAACAKAGLCYNPRSSFTPMFPQQASEWRCACRGACPEPVERVSRPLGSTTSGPRLLSAETQAARMPLQGAPVNGHACHAVASCEGEPTIHPQPSTLNSVRAAFTLLELLIVIGIIALLLVLLAPAFTTIKSAGRRHQRRVHDQRRARHRAHLRESKQHLHLGRLF